MTQKISQLFRKIALVVGFVAQGLAQQHALAAAETIFPGSEPAPPSNSLSQTNRSRTPRDDPRLSRPRTRTVAASRGDCQVAGAGLPELLTVVPDEFYFEALPTTSPRPTFWAYSPYIVEADTKVEFVLYAQEGGDTSGDPIVTQLIEAVGPGIFSIPFPSTAPSLEVGKVYEWFIKVYCDNEDVIPIADAALVTLIRTGSDNNTAWYDRLHEFADALSRNPNSPLRRDWEDLLRSSGLAALLDQPVID